MKIKVLMVCLGNICRSPLAEGILRSKIDSSQVLVDSAGTGGWHAGELPDSRSVAVARKNGLDITDQRARKFRVEDLDLFDRIYVMDNSNYRDVLQLAKTEQQRQKVQLILNLVFPGENVDVPDPYYGGNQGFDQVYAMLDEACDIIATEI
ncbi:low molecular weight protein-tyrosine-phosphatase [Aureitalea marina]|uniref:protein-tyrosine-phosphatase n=1 Tax=Aureitalea marina TaxID=930804 RepID=A0A2S7KN25_9FLAO|nr:low molecular weight protein-tyrosine-phosphatase [Aureitalea marina]PQB04012.1 protein-tyrosine-phosphatase [Aureitalea marina]